MARLAQYKEKLLNEFEQKTDNWTFGSFEQRLKEIRKNTSYHDAKGIISTAHDLGYNTPRKLNNFLESFILLE